MTCREKLAIEHPEELDSGRFGGCKGCPQTYKYAKEPEWCKMNNETCTKCWDREVETDVKADVDTDVDSGERTVEQKMTCREKLAMDRPEEVDSECLGGCTGCPSTYGYAKKPEWCKPGEENCTNCWDREVEEVETGAETEVENSIKSGDEMTVFASGAVRDKKTGKGRCDLLPACVLLRLAKHYERGAERYGPYNWQKGIPCHSFVDSALRHMLKYMDGQTDEDHLIAAIWNLCGLAWTEEKLPELMDIPERQGKQAE